MIYLGSDHGGYELKEKLKEWLAEWGYRYEDCGSEEFDAADDYPDFAAAVARRVAKSSTSGDSLRETPDVLTPGVRGIVICRNGVGVSIVANKFRGVRCGLCFNQEHVKTARLDDDINVLSLPADYLTNAAAKSIVRTFLTTEFSGEERHIRRLRKIEKIESRY